MTLFAGLAYNSRSTTAFSFYIYIFFAWRFSSLTSTLRKLQCLNILSSFSINSWRFSEWRLRLCWSIRCLLLPFIHWKLFGNYTRAAFCALNWHLTMSNCEFKRSDYYVQTQFIFQKYTASTSDVIVLGDMY